MQECNIIFISHLRFRASMKELEDIAAQIEDELDEKDTLREIALKSCRAIIRLSGAATRAMHKEEDPSSLLAEARDEASKLRGLVLDHPDLGSAGFVEDAYQELTEACIIYAILNKMEIPSPMEIEVTSTAYLLALGDTIGELRRSSLDALRKGNVDESLLRLEQMEEIFDILMRFDYPAALVAIRRKQDIARTLIEKTRGDVTLALRSKKLEEKLEKISKKLKEA